MFQVNFLRTSGHPWRTRDSQWQTMELTTPCQGIHKLSGNSGYPWMIHGCLPNSLKSICRHIFWYTWIIYGYQSSCPLPCQSFLGFPGNSSGLSMDTWLPISPYVRVYADYLEILDIPGLSMDSWFPICAPVRVFADSLETPNISGSSNAWLPTPLYRQIPWKLRTSLDHLWRPGFLPPPPV